MTNDEKEVFLILNGWSEHKFVDGDIWINNRYPDNYFILDYAYQIETAGLTDKIYYDETR